MRRLSLWFLLFCLFGVPGALSTRQPAPTPLAILHVTVIDAAGAEAAPDQTVIIKGDRISSIGKTGEVAIPKDANTVDAKGKFLIPGLWDMHVHALQNGRPELFFSLLLANGVTGVRDPGSPLNELAGVKKLRELIDEGKFLGPRIVAAGPLVDGPSPMFPDLSISATTASQARQVVGRLKSAGADFIKVYQLLPRDAYFALADETRRLNMPFAGHVPESVSASEASDAGQKSIEHLSGVRLSCSTREAKLRKELAQARATSDPALLYRALRRVYTESRKTYSREKAGALFARFVANDTWQVPTLVVARFVARFNKSRATSPKQKAALALQGRKELKHASCLDELTADEFESVSAGRQNAYDLVDAMRRAGVKFMAGTDAPNPFVVPGPSLHDELELLVEAGFTRLEALQSATRNPAEYLGRLDTLGTVEKGKIADLVLLDANPLEDIGNTRKIWAVITRGRILDATSLKEMSSNAALEAYRAAR